MSQYNEINTDNMDNLLPLSEEQELLRNVFQRSNNPVPNIEEEWAKIKGEIKNDVDENVDDSQYEIGSKSRRPLFMIIGGIVAVAACLAFIFLLPTSHTVELPSNIVALSQQQKQDKVIVCNENDETIALTQARFSLKENKDVPKTVENLKIVTPRGKDCHIVLADGTKVWLNAESELEFPSRFERGKRIVHLKGEAFFEVIKDKKHPFVVKNEFFTTTVLGTVFNVRAFNKNDANVVLVSGKIAVNTGIFSDTFYVKPGQKAVCNGRNDWKISYEDTYPYTQRKEGYFYFNHSSLHEIMAEIGRWYNKTVVFENTAIMSMQLHFVAERSQNLNQIIEQLNQMDDLDIVVGKNEIVIR